MDHALINHRDRYGDNDRGLQKLGVAYTSQGRLAEYILAGGEILERATVIDLRSERQRIGGLVSRR